MRIKNPLVLREGTPATPPSGHVALYSADGSALLMKDDAGVVSTLGGGSKVSALSAVTTPAGTDEFLVNQGGTSKKMTLSQVNVYTEPIVAVANNLTGFASDTYLLGVTLVPARLQAGSVYHARFDLSKTAAGTAVAAINLRLGTAGTTADTSRILFTFPSAGTAATDDAWVEIQANFVSVGSGTSAVIRATCTLLRRNTTTGFLSTSATTVTHIRVNSSGFDSTAVTKMGISINGGASASWTLNTGQAELLNLT